jgi:hypothetical protein
MKGELLMTLLQEYKNSLKMAEVEEPLDLFFYRPIAFGIVKLIYRLPITPNQVTLLSLGAGLAAAYCFSLGTGGALIAAAIWYAVANILDCCDGMLARLQGSGSPLGRLVDGIADWAIAVAIFVGLGIGLEISTGDPAVWYLVVAGGLTSALHAVVFDLHQQEYLSGVRGDRSFHSKETEKVEKELGELRGKKGAWWRKAVLRTYMQYLKVQGPVKGKSENKHQVPPEVFRQHNRRVMRWWTLLGTTTNRTLLILAALLHAPFAFLWIVVVAGNLYLLFMLLQQRIASRRMVTLAP